MTAPARMGWRGGWSRLAEAILAVIPAGEIDGLWQFLPIRFEQREFGTAIVSRRDGDRRRIYTAQYALTIRGKERGAFEHWLEEVGSGPVEALAKASDEIASGNYAVQVPVGRGGDEISHLSERFNQMAARLAATEERERQFLMSVSHELRTPLTAIKGHVDALRDGLVDDPELVAASLEEPATIGRTILFNSGDTPIAEALAG